MSLSDGATVLILTDYMKYIPLAPDIIILTDYMKYIHWLINELVRWRHRLILIDYMKYTPQY